MKHRLALNLIVLVAVALLLAVPVENQYARIVVVEILIFGLLAISFDVVYGYTGLLSLGQALYFGVGAYGTAYGVYGLGLSFPAAAGVGLAAGTSLAFVTGYIATRVKGHAFLVVTLIFVSVAYAWAQNNRDITGGDDGIVLPAKLFTFAGLELDARASYALVIGLFLAAYAATVALLHSPFGLLLRAIRENDKRSEYLGYNTRWIKLAAFTWAGGLAALGGIAYVLTFKLVHTGVIHWSLSADALIWAFFGGLGTLAGPLLGVAILIPFEEVMSEAYGVPRLFTGLLLVAMVLIHKGGIAGLALKAIRAGGKRAAAHPAQTEPGK
jgi:branched-chain amino acid transport system permease protein